MTFVMRSSNLPELFKRVTEWESKGYETAYPIAKEQGEVKKYRNDMHNYNHKQMKKGIYSHTDNFVRYYVKMKKVEETC